MEFKEKVVKYCKFDWKLAVPNVAEDADYIVSENSHKCIVTVIKPITDLEQSDHLCWLCKVQRKLTPNPDGQTISDIKVTVAIMGRPKILLKGFYKISITDQEGKILPGEFLYVCLENDLIEILYRLQFTRSFNNVNCSVDHEDQYFVCFELYIAVDEKHMTGLNRSTNDLSLLLDESLLTDSVLRVSGREISVHRVILAARWPRFYERFLDGSIDSVVDVGEIEPEAFEKLLKCVYSNRIPVSLFQDTACKDLAQTLEQTRFLKHIQTNKQRQNSTDLSTNISADHLDSDSLQLLTPENGKSVHESITYRSFTYSTVITKKEYNQSTTSLDSTLNTVFPGKHDNVSVAIWKISLKKFDEKKHCNYCRLKLIALENASFVRARTRLCIYNIEGRRLVEINTFDQYDLYSEEIYPLDFEPIHTSGQRSLVDHIPDDEKLTIYLNIDIQVDDLAAPLYMKSSDDLGSLLVDGHLSDVILCVGDRKFPVHRAILAAKSPVFRAMFTSNMKESVAKEILNEDMEPDVMEELLRCVYTDQVPVECGCDMLIAFDRFGLISLLDRCQDSVTITVENAFEVFAVAEELNAKRLKMRILKFLTNREMRTQGTMIQTS